MVASSPKDKIETVPDKLICQSCGAEFSCGARAGKCWCFEVELKADSLARLREDFQNCLCADCLENLRHEA